MQNLHLLLKWTSVHDLQFLLILKLDFSRNNLVIVLGHFHIKYLLAYDKSVVHYRLAVLVIQEYAESVLLAIGHLNSGLDVVVIHLQVLEQLHQLLLRERVDVLHLPV